MPNLVKITEGRTDLDPDTKFVVDVAKRLVPIIGTELDKASAIALAVILELDDIEFTDGFLTNTDDQGIWKVDAASICAAFCKEPDEDYRWWRYEIASKSVECGNEIEAHHHLVWNPADDG